MDFTNETCLFLFLLSHIFFLFSKNWPKASIVLNNLHMLGMEPPLKVLHSLRKRIKNFFSLSNSKICSFLGKFGLCPEALIKYLDSVFGFLELSPC